MNQVDTDKFVRTDAYGHITGGEVQPITLGTAGCGLHPRYVGERPPRVKCRTCRALYRAAHK